MKTIDELLANAEKEFKHFKAIKKRFPDAKLGYLNYNESVIMAKSAGPLVDSYKPVDLNVGFYFSWNETKIFADPIIKTLDFRYHETDWLEQAIEAGIRPQVLVELMRNRRSQYLSVKYYFNKYPQLPTWLAQF